MATYTGPATLILEDGTEVAVDASLSSSRVNDLTEWKGTLTTDSPNVLWNEDGKNLPLRIMDGRIGDVLIRSVGSETGVQHIRVAGNGPAPF
jgi:hypothetical protein